MVPDTSIEWDVPETSVTDSFVICTTPRTGSNLLAFTLAEQGIGVPLEYLNLYGNPNIQEFMARMLEIPSDQNLSIESLEQLQDIRTRYLSKVQTHRTTPNGFFGVKVFPNHITLLFPERPSLAPLCKLIRPEPKFVYLFRQDVCSMAVSFHFASYKQEWHSDMKPEIKQNSQVPYDFHKLLKHAKVLHALQNSWKNFLKDYPQERILSISYSSLTKDFSATMSAVNTFLGSPNTPIPEEPIQRQESPEKQVMVSLFKNECKQRQPWLLDVDYRLNS